MGIYNTRFPFRGWGKTVLFLSLLNCIFAIINYRARLPCRRQLYQTMNEQKTTRIPWEHAIFVTELIRHGDKERAYGKAYPNASPASRKPAACRLANRPELKEIIEEKQAAAIEKGFAAAEAAAAERFKMEFLSLQEKRAELA